MREQGQRIIACAADADSYCVSCPPLTIARQVYATVGRCDGICDAGYYDAGGVCLLCASYPCDVGRHVSASACQLPADRLAPPSCAACPPLPPGATFVSGCSAACIDGYYSLAETCAPCNATALCPLGTRMICVGGIYTCVDCGPLPSYNRYFVAGGSCESACLPGAQVRLTCDLWAICSMAKAMEAGRQLRPHPCAASANTYCQHSCSRLRQRHLSRTQVSTQLIQHSLGGSAINSYQSFIKILFYLTNEPKPASLRHPAATAATDESISTLKHRYTRVERSMAMVGSACTIGRMMSSSTTNSIM